MSKELLETPLLEASAKDDNENYSEWRLLGPSCFSEIQVNTGFQARDFRTNHETLVVDPETYRKIQKEANSMWGFTSFDSMVLLFSILPISAFTPYALMEGSAVLVIMCFLPFFVCVYIYNILYTRANNRTHTLVDSYKEHFLKEYGVDLGYSKFTTRGEDGAFVVPGIYLRRPHTSREEKDFGDSIPPIFIDRTMPGDVDLFRTANLDLTVADAKACSLLQSIYLEEMKIQPFPGMFYILALPLVIFLFTLSSLLFAGADFLAMILASFSVFGFAYVLLMVLQVMDAKDFGNRKALQALRQCQEVAQRVNEALQNDKDIAGTLSLSVEFSTSQLPGRDERECRRFQFVRHNTAPNTTGRDDMTDVSGCV